MTEKYNDIKKLQSKKEFQKIEALALNILSTCNEFTEIKIIYIEALLENNKPNDALIFIKNKLSQDELKLDCFKYYEAKAHYFNYN